jgi:serine phosphatase RsbU (regulator of sigma subunit)
MASQSSRVAIHADRDLLDLDLLELEKRSQQQASWLLAGTLVVLNLITEYQYADQHHTFRLFTLVLSAVLIFWFVGSAVLIRFGHYHHLFKYVNLVVQVSTVTFFLLTSARLMGVEYALSSVSPLFYVLIIGMSGLTLNPFLCLLAGGFAAGQFVGAYAFWLHGEVVSHYPDSLSLGWPSIVLKAVVFLAMGIAAMFMARRSRSLLEQVADQVRYEERLKFIDEDMGQAAEIQERLVQVDLSPRKGLEIETYYQPSQQVGGDYFDLIETPNGTYVLVVADVSGKGYAAALLMANIQSIVRLLVQQGADLVGIIQHLNGAVAKASARGRFVSLACVELDPNADVIRYINCGHNAPILIDGEGNFRALETQAPVLGVVADCLYQAETLPFTPNCLLFAYTDGLSELRNPEGKQLGEEGIKVVLESHYRDTASILKQSILRAIDDYLEHGSPGDDLSFICVRRS